MAQIVYSSTDFFQVWFTNLQKQLDLHICISSSLGLSLQIAT